jgi:hypothetical protein
VPGRGGDRTQDLSNKRRARCPLGHLGMGIGGWYGRWVQIQYLSDSEAVRMGFWSIFFVNFVGYIALHTAYHLAGLFTFAGVLSKVYRFGSGIVSCISANSGRIGAGKVSDMFIWSKSNYEFTAGLKFDRNRDGENRVFDPSHAIGDAVAGIAIQPVWVGPLHAAGFPGSESVSWIVAGQIQAELSGRVGPGPCDPRRCR